MQAAKTRIYLEAITNSAVLLTSIALLSTFALSYLVRSTKPQFQTGLQKGRIFAQLPGVDYRSSSRTLILAMSSKSVSCDASVPFYRQLIETQYAHDKPPRFLAVFSDAGNIAGQYVRQNQLKVDTVSGVDLERVNLGVTPTAVLVDDAGKILNFWIGKLSPDAERQVVESITTR